MLKRIVDRLEEGVISLLLVGMTLLVFYEVILRFVFNTGLGWIQEVMLLTSAWMVLLGASYGIKVGCHIGVDAVVRLLPSGPRDGSASRPPFSRSSIAEFSSMGRGST